MVTTKTLSIAEAIAANYDKSLNGYTSAIVTVLNNTSGGALPLTAENYRHEVPKNTRENPEYLTVMEESSTILAEKIRCIFDQISIYGKGLTRHLVNVIEREESAAASDRAIAEFLSGGIEFSFIKVDHPFFSSPMYPTEAPKTSMDFNGVSNLSFKKVSFPNMESRDILAWINTPNKEIGELLLSPSVDLSSVLSCLSRPYNIGVKYDYDKESIDFTQPNFSDHEKLFAAYIMVSKMYASEEPLSGVSGSLADYRELITLLYFGLTIALVQLKAIAAHQSSVPIRVTEIKPATVMNSPVVEGGEMYPRVRGKVAVHFNTVGAEMCISNKTTLSDVATAYLYARYVTIKGDEAHHLLSDVTRAVGVYSDQRHEIRRRINERAGKIYCGYLRAGLSEFLREHPELEPYLGEEGITGFANNLIVEHYGEDIARGISSKNRQPLENIIMGSGFLHKFLCRIDCADAAWILDRTRHEVSDSASTVEKRQALTVTIYRYLARMLLTPER